MVVGAAASPAAGLAFASSIAAGMEYEAVRKEKWYNNMTDLQKSMYTQALALLRVARKSSVDLLHLDL